MKNSGFKFPLIAFAFLIFNFAFAFNANAQNEQPPAPSAPRSAQIPQPVERTLKNGLRVIVVERKNVPLVTAQLMIKSGGEVDPKNLAGAADMTAELLTKGTKTRTATQIAEQIEFLGGSIESGASWDSSAVTVRVMSDKLDKALEIVADTVRNPTFKQEEIDRFKTQLLDELEVSLKQPGNLAGYVANRVVFGDKPYGHPLTGTPESIKRISRVNLVDLHRQNYIPHNSILIFAGDVAPNNAFAIAEKYFGNWQNAGSQASRNPGGNTEVVGFNENKSSPNQQSVKVNQITVVDLPNAGQAAVFLANKGIRRGSRVYYDAIVMNSILGGGYSARLNQEIRIKRGLSYGARSDLSPLRTAGFFSARTQTKNESAGQVAQLIVEEITKLVNEPVSQNELVPRKAVVTGDFSRDLETTNGLVERIGELALYNLDLNEINSFISNVQNVSETNVRNFAGLLNNSEANIIIVGDAKMFLSDLSKRFPTAKTEVISVSELDLNSATLRRTKTIAPVRKASKKR